MLSQGMQPAKRGAPLRAPAGPEPGTSASLGHTSAAVERQKRPWL